MTTGGRRTGAVLVGLLVMAVLVVLDLPFMAWPAHADDRDEGGVDLSVEVLGPTPTPSPSSTPTGPTVPPTSTPTVPTPTPTPTNPADDPLKGLIHVGKLSASYVPSFNPFAGAVVAHFTVRSLAPQSVDATAVFWVTNAFGAQVGRPGAVTVPVTRLKPGETRVVTALLGPVGQWGYLTANMTFYPPERIGRTRLSPVTRTAPVLYLPWFPLLLCAPPAVAGVLFLRRRRLLETMARAAGVVSGGPL